MLGWFVDKMVDMRVAMATKEAKWILEALPPSRRAFVLVRATETRLSYLRDPLTVPCADVMMSPNQYSTQVCFHIAFPEFLANTNGRARRDETNDGWLQILTTPF